MLKTCVVGLGQMGQNHARVLSDLAGVVLVGVADPAEAARRAYRAPGGVGVFADYRRMLEELRPDAVTVSVPTQAHCEVACAALEAGAHVLVEKPIAATCEEADRMSAVARRAGKKLMVGHVERFNPAVAELKRALDAGEIGHILQLHARRLGPLPARVHDVGVVLDLATHDIDVMHYLTGGAITRVSAETARGTPETMLAGLLRFDTGAIGLLDVHWLAPSKVRELAIVGEAGTFVADYLSQEVRLLRAGAPVHHASIEKREPLRVEHEHFAQCIVGDATPHASAEAGRAALAVALRLLDSARTT